MPYNVIMCGDRNWTEEEIIEDVIKYLLPPHAIIFQGGCSGADDISKTKAEKLGHTVRTFNADWKKYGKSAGPIRNQEMINEGVSLVLAFHNNIELSKGTKNIIELAKKHKVDWILFGSTGVTNLSHNCEDEYK